MLPAVRDRVISIQFLAVYDMHKIYAISSTQENNGISGRVASEALITSYKGSLRDMKDGMNADNIN
jgi:hypothetical protein